MERLDQVTRSEAAVRAVRTAILDGTLAPGSQLRETHIAGQLGISRAPLREALHRLEEEGLVVRFPFRGAFVAEISPKAAKEIEALRAVLEPYAVEQALPLLSTEEGSRELSDAVQLLTERVADRDRAGCIDAHLAIHRAIYRAAGNDTLFGLWESWEGLLRLFLAVDHQSFTNLDDLAEDHRRLLGIIKSGDKKAIRAELSRHIHPGLPDPKALTKARKAAGRRSSGS
jgi:DNA-binding GntR family transcriptional regulator